MNNNNAIKKKTAPSKRPKFISTPKGYLLVLLIIYSLMGLSVNGSVKSLVNETVAVLTAVLMDLIINKILERKYKFPDGAILTGMIVGLVLSPIFPWYLTALTAAIADLSKHMFSMKRKPIFNPAALGLLVSIPLFSSQQSWWGGLSTLPQGALIFLIIGGLIITNRIHKFPQVVSFLFVYFLMLLGLSFFNGGLVADLYRMPYINSALFLAFFMLTDPPTSPAKSNEQIIFGTLTAIISVLAYLKFGGLSFLLIGLLAANLLNAAKILYTSSSKKIAAHS